MRFFKVYFFALVMSFSFNSAVLANIPSGFPDLFDSYLLSVDCPATSKNTPNQGKCLSWNSSEPDPGKKLTIRWPDNEGCAGSPKNVTLPVGTVIDRFGTDEGKLYDYKGNFFSPEGESFNARALPYTCSALAYRTYRVEKPLKVRACTAAPWFQKRGGATQYMSDYRTGDLLKRGDIVLQVSAADAARRICTKS